MIYDYVCIGYGIATASFLLTLTATSNIQKFNIIVFDEAFDGGELRRNYGQVQSNTTWQQFLSAVEKYCSPAKFKQLQTIHKPEETTTLDELVHQQSLILKSALADSSIKVHRRCETVKEITYSSADKTWTINDIKARVAIFCPGAKPRSLHLPKPTLQLSSVLNKKQLPCRPGDHVVIFGTSHSGTLAIKALHDYGVRVTAIYNGNKPFKYARDGEYDGIKQESANIADSLPDTIKLISNSNESAVRAELIDCDWVLYATGFDRRNDIIVKYNNTICDINTYDTTTGKLQLLAPAFGFGIAYPNSNDINGKRYYDVSLPAFIAHIEKNLNVILEASQH